MQALSSATVLCRVLLGLDRSEASGSLHLRAEGRRATLSLEDGVLVGAKLDGRVPSSSRQLITGVSQLCEWEELVLQFSRQASSPTGWPLRDPVRANRLALQVMRSIVRQVEPAAIRAELGAGVYHLNEVGEALAGGTELQSEEVAAVFWLRRGVRAEDIQGLPGAGLRACRFVWILKLLRGAAPKSGGSYPLLLRKRRELRGQVSARALLDLPEGADGRDARLALRKLVRNLHPDRFGESVPPALRRASGEIVTALVNAEAAVAAE
jgi:hypothetical protein